MKPTKFFTVYIYYDTDVLVIKLTLRMLYRPKVFKKSSLWSNGLGYLVEEQISVNSI